MAIRTGKLHKPCKRCGKVYPATTVKPGVCKKCIKPKKKGKTYIPWIKNGKEILKEVKE